MKRDKTHAPLPNDHRHPLCGSFGWCRLVDTERWPDDVVDCKHCLRILRKGKT